MITRIDAATAASSGAVSSQAVTIPATAQDGDLLILAAAITATAAYDALDGWTNVADFNVPSAACRVGVWYRVAEGGDASSSVEPALSSGTGCAAAQVIVYRGVDQTTPMDTTPVAADSGGAAETTPAAPAITTATAGALIVAVMAVPTQGGTVLTAADWTDPAGADDELVTCSTDAVANNACVSTYAAAAPTAGAYGPYQATITQSRRWGAVTLALREEQDTPPPAGGGIGGWGWIPAGP